jgi:hypothetical protein
MLAHQAFASDCSPSPRRSLCWPPPHETQPDRSCDPRRGEVWPPDALGSVERGGDVEATNRKADEEVIPGRISTEHSQPRTPKAVIDSPSSTSATFPQPLPVRLRCEDHG